ncbi:hypothetical protein F5Y04DRAFT_271871 [Hypomontagnella monticulosa]|nr:hypothetical protein F5Y04DRAFT_271871 [Hypomontagnella monticulosa]
MPPTTLQHSSSTLSPLSSPNSFATATESPRNLLDVADITTTDISSPVPDPEDVENKSYSQAGQLPSDLKKHCQIYIEENLYLITLNLLNSMLSSSHDDPTRLNYCPAPSQLSLLCTAVVHPKFTTRPKEEGWSEVSAESLVYLRSLFSRLGPINGRFKEAFRFISSSRHGTPESQSGNELEFDDDDPLDPSYAQLKRRYHEDGLWRRGQDFFHIVGWAFNCSVLYPNRWRYWRNWLKFMLDVLEEDLAERHKLDEESGDKNFPMLRESILAGYIAQRSGRSTGGLKVIMEAIFADGSVTASSRFQEIWQKEHKENPKSAAKKRKRETVNIEKGNFGGYLDDESVYSSQASEPPTPQKRRTSGNLGDPDFQALEPTYVESIPLRQRIFSLLSYLCHYLPDPPLDLSDLYQRFETTVKPLPLPIFTAFVNTHTSALRLESKVSTLQGILLLLMPSAALSPAKVDCKWRETGGITAEILERCFLPYPANTIAVEDNAKVSVLLENLLQLLWCEIDQKFGKDFRAAVEKGIEAREAKVKKKKTSMRGRTSAEDPDAEARAVLDMSGERLLTLLDLIKGENEAEDTIVVDAMDEDEDEDEEDNIDATFMTAIDDTENNELIDDDADEGEYEKMYCLCQSKESGQMVACGNSACPYEWFHWKCVGLQAKPKGKWLCPKCANAKRPRGRPPKGMGK